MKQNMEHLAEDRSASSLSKMTASSSGDTVVRRPGVSRIDFAPMVEVTKKPGFLPKVFSRPNLRAKDKNSTKSRVRFENRNNAQDIDKRLGHLSITPVPYVRPLGFKMEPRVEPGPRNERMIYMDDLHLPDVQRDISRSREEAECELADHLPTHSSQRTLRACKSQPVLNSQATLLSLHGSQDSEANISLTIARQREAVASMAASDAFNVVNWKAYLQSYSEGRFNLNVPPHPPPRAASFTYLPAIFPDDEEKRQLVSNVYDTVWPGWEQSKTGTLLRDAMKRFVAPFAAVSFFDGAEEYFKAEKGYNKRHIPRAISVAAHVLLSSDVLIVLDTYQDWRFAGNPLVVDGPKIRFFAGAPMLAPGGEIIGVIAIFDTQPRKAFTPSERRDLAEFSQLAMQDLDLRLELLSDEDVRSTPILQRSSLINASTPPRAQKSPSPKSPSRESYESMLEEDMDMFPSALRFHKDYPKPRVSRLFMSNEGQDATEPTPPSSSGSEAVAPLFYQKPRGFGKNLNQLSINSGQDLSSFHDLITPDSAGFARSSPRPLSTSDPVGFISPSPRPFSSSDLTSLDPHPPNTPNTSLVEGTMPAPLHFEDITVESFMSLTDLDIAEEDVDQEPSTNPPSSPLIDLNTPQKHDSISTDISSRSNNSSKSSGTQKLTGDSEFMTEAAFSCQFTAQNLGYDLVYAAQVKPAREFMTEEELTQPGGLKVKILVAYGLDKPLDLCAATHLRILRSQGFETIEHVSGYQYQEDEYETGHMMRLVDDGLPREERRSGIVFGAFRKPKDQQLFRMETPPRVEMQKLLNAAEALRFILTKSMERAKNQRSLAAELAAVEAYPANEALEVGRSLRSSKSSPESRMPKRD